MKYVNGKLILDTVVSSITIEEAVVTSAIRMDGGTVISFGNGAGTGQIAASTLTITGNLVVQGTTTQVNSEVSTSDALINVNDGEVGAGMTVLSGGLDIDRGSENPYRFAFFEVDNLFRVGEYYVTLPYTGLTGTFTVGEVVTGGISGASAKIVSDSGTQLILRGANKAFQDTETITGLDSTATATAGVQVVTDNTQAVATREDAPADTGVPYWDDATNKFVTSSTFTFAGGALTVPGPVKPTSVDLDDTTSLFRLSIRSTSAPALTSDKILTIDVDDTSQTLVVADVALNTTHRGDTNNPHATDLGNLGTGTLAELNTLVSSSLIPTYGGLRDVAVGTLAQRPAAGTANRFWFSIDELALYRDNGSNWEGVNAWQQTVEDILAAPPGGLTQADSGRRWLVSAFPDGGGAFVGKPNHIATYFDDGLASGWYFATPQWGWFVNVAKNERNEVYEYYDGSLPPTGNSREAGWILRGNQNVGTTASPTFIGATLTGKPTEQPQSAIRRNELREYSWQGSVKNHLAIPPVGPSLGDRYIIRDDASELDWGQTPGTIVANKIAVWSFGGGSVADYWAIYTPSNGTTVYHENNEDFYTYTTTTGWYLQGNIFTPYVKPELVLTNDPKDFDWAVRLGHLENSKDIHVVVDSQLTTPPGAPPQLARYIVPSGATGVWSTNVGKIAVFVESYSPITKDDLSSAETVPIPAEWKFITPREGMIAYDQTNDLQLQYDGGSWVTYTVYPKAHAASHTDGTDDIQDASAVQKGLINTVAQSIAGDKTFLNALKVALLNSGDEIITTDTNGELQESGVKVTQAPAGGSGFTFVEYATAPVNPPAGFVWVQAKDANTKTLNYYNGVITFSVDVSV